MPQVDYSGGLFPVHAESGTFANPPQWLIDIFGGGRDVAGVAVTPEVVLAQPAAFFQINRISNDVAQLPLRVMMRNEEGGDTEDRKHPAGKIMRTQPGAATNPYHQRKSIQLHALAVGNGRAFIVRTGRQEPAELIPLDSRKMRTIFIGPSDGEGRIAWSGRQKWHLYYPEDGKPVIPLPDKDILHIHGASIDSAEGMSVPDLFRSTIGTNQGMQTFQAKFLKNNGRPSLVLEAPPGAFRTQEQAEEFLRSFNERHAGVDNAGRVGLLREGIKASPISQPFKDNQVIESRDFYNREQMRIWGMGVVPGVSDSQSYNSLEQQSKAYLIHTLGPWLRIWEAECNAKLLTRTEQERETHYFEFDTDLLIRPDAAAFMELLVKGVSATIYSPNDARNELGLAPREGGDVYGNPATSSPNSQPPSDQQQDAQQQATARLKRMATAKLRPLVAMEKRRIAEMANRATDFCGCVADFYGKHSARLAEAVEEIEGPSWLAAAHCEEMQEIMLHIAGQAKTNQELFDAVNQAAAAWDKRLDDMAAACAGE